MINNKNTSGMVYQETRILEGSYTTRRRQVARDHWYKGDRMADRTARHTAGGDWRENVTAPNDVTFALI